MWKFPMEKLTLNEEKVWTILKDFPNGAKAELLMQLTKLPRTTLYECLDGLTEKGYVENKNRKWYPKIAEAEKPSTEKLNTVKTALEYGILTKEDLELIASIDFFLQNPELIGIDNSEESKSIKDVLKLVKNFHLQKIESLKNIEADSK